jgi:hypothetical protein
MSSVLVKPSVLDMSKPPVVARIASPGRIKSDYACIPAYQRNSSLMIPSRTSVIPHLCDMSSVLVKPSVLDMSKPPVVARTLSPVV